MGRHLDGTKCEEAALNFRARPESATRNKSGQRMRHFPLFVATVDQVLAYVRYYGEKHDPAVAFLASAFTVFGLALALIIDLALLPVKLAKRAFAKTG